MGAQAARAPLHDPHTLSYARQHTVSLPPHERPHATRSHPPEHYTTHPTTRTTHTTTGKQNTQTSPSNTTT